MFRYKINQLKFIGGGVLKESLNRVPKSLTLKSKKKLSDRQVFDKASKYLNENYGVVLQESEVYRKFFPDFGDPHYTPSLREIVEIYYRDGGEMDEEDLNIIKNSLKNASPYERKDMLADENIQRNIVRDINWGDFDFLETLIEYNYEIPNKLLLQCAFNIPYLIFDSPSEAKAKARKFFIFLIKKYNLDIFYDVSEGERRGGYTIFDELARLGDIKTIKAISHLLSKADNNALSRAAMKVIFTDENDVRYSVKLSILRLMRDAGTKLSNEQIGTIWSDYDNTFHRFGDDPIFRSELKFYERVMELFGHSSHK